MILATVRAMAIALRAVLPVMLVWVLWVIEQMRCPFARPDDRLTPEVSMNQSCKSRWGERG